VVGYGPFSLSVIYKEGLCPSSGDINDDDDDDDSILKKHFSISIAPVQIREGAAISEYWNEIYSRKAD
jgi:hypothetical protein